MALEVGVDTYATEDEICEILESHGHASFLQATPGEQLEALARQAVAYLDHAWEYAGARTVAGQPLQWPRVGCVDKDGLPIASDAIPTEIIQAQALLVYAAGFGDLFGPSGGSDRLAESEAADDASVTYGKSSHLRRYPLIGRLLAHLITLRTAGSFKQVRAARG